MYIWIFRNDDFEFTPECAIFDLLDIPLYHGWIVDPQVSNFWLITARNFQFLMFLFWALFVWNLCVWSRQSKFMGFSVVVPKWHITKALLRGYWNLFENCILNASLYHIQTSTYLSNSMILKTQYIFTICTILTVPLKLGAWILIIPSLL